MNDTQKQHRQRPQRDGLFADPGRIAPSVEKGWRDDFIIELRMLSVPGDRIGDALMTVETHVAESGESAQEAFGDPSAYAREIAESEGAVGTSWVVNTWTVVGNITGLVGMLAAVRAFTAWLQGGAVPITAGEVVGLVVLLLLVGAVLGWSTTAIRFMVDHTWTFAILAPLLLIGTFVAIFFLFPQTWFEMGVVPLAVLAAVLILASVVASLLDGPDDGDQIVAPGQRATSSGLARWGTALILPFLTLLLLGLTWLLHSMA